MSTRILALSNLFWRPWDSTRGTFNQALFSRLSERHALTLLVPLSLSEIFAHWSAFWALKRNGDPRFPYVVFFPYVHVPRLSQGFNDRLIFLCLLLSCPRIALRQRWEVLVGSWLFPDAVALSYLSAWRKLPLVAIALGSDVNVLAQRTIQRAKITRLIRRSKFAVGVSEALTQQMRALAGDAARCVTIYNGVDAQQFAPRDRARCRQTLGLAPEASVVLFIGSLIEAKGCMELLEATARVSRARPDLRLVMIGKGAEQAQIQARARHLGIDPIVQFTGAIAHEELPEWLGAANLFCLPSHREGVPNVIMEAMACGVPVVATNVGGIPEVVPPFAGTLVPPQQVAALVEAITERLNTPAQPGKIRAHAQQFTWAHSIEAYEALFAAP